MFSNKCVALIKKWEGFSPVAYPDPQSGGAPWTIGYGFTTFKGRKVQPGDTMTSDEADAHFLIELTPYNIWVRSVVKVPLTQGQEDALTCWVFNIGPTKAKTSTAVRRLNQGDYQGAAQAMTWWISPGTRVERGLRRRRQEEQQLFVQGV